MIIMQIIYRGKSEQEMRVYINDSNNISNGLMKS